MRRAEQDYLFVLVPGDREIAWPKLRTLLGVSRISMPDAAGAKETAVTLRATAALDALDAGVADVTEPPSGCERPPR